MVYVLAFCHVPSSVQLYTIVIAIGFEKRVRSFEQKIILFSYVDHDLLLLIASYNTNFEVEKTDIQLWMFEVYSHRSTKH